MNNKTATECWNILRGELDSAIDSYVPMKKQGKRSVRFSYQYNVDVATKDTSNQKYHRELQ